ncbi:MAG: response regulator transcription factor [Chloroflexi bacterium]|nr:response regulator transcription factor [Chloroflexota bacterium]
MPLREAAGPPGGGASATLTGTRVLVVEDDPGFRIAIEAALEDAGCELMIIDDGNEALRGLYSFRPDLALLDIRLPGMNGLDLCERIRTMSEVPIIIFSALHDTGEKLIAFERGADDYVVKDTPMEELTARIALALRHAGASSSSPEVEESYADSCVEIDFTRYAVRVRGEAVDLTPTEYKILTLLVKREGQPVPPQQLLRRVWGPEYDSEDLVKWHVGHLRRKIELNPERPTLVVTRRGFGYVYATPAA